MGQGPPHRHRADHHRPLSVDHRELIPGVVGATGGDGRPVLFVHGVMDRGAAFLRVIRRLDDVQWTIYDRRGYGRSNDSGAPTFSGHVDDLIAIIDMTPTDEPITVVGHSLGGLLSLHAAALRPDRIRSLVIYEAPLSFLDWWPQMGPDGRRIEDDEPEVALDRFMRRVIGDRAWDSLPEATRTQRLDEWPTVLAELVSVRSEGRFDPSSVAAPVIVSRAGPSGDQRVRAGEWLVENLPDASLVVLDDSMHNAHMGDAERFAGLVQRAVAVGA